jgi:hypothetical protein
VAIYGTGFTGATAVKFGTVNAASFSIISDTLIFAITPAAAATTVDVTIVTSGGTSATGAADRFTFIAPAVTLLSPTSGPAAGGTAVAIYGTGFTGATAVKFGSVNAAGFAVLSDTLIFATTPAEPGGTVDVTVVTPGGTTATSSADRFTFVAPAVTFLSPNNGPTAGGTAVAIYGTGFTGATAVFFGSVNAASFSIIGDTLIFATTPAEPAGTVDVTVVTPGGTTATSSADRFTFLAPPSVHSRSGTVTNVIPPILNGLNQVGATFVDVSGVFRVQDIKVLTGAETGSVVTGPDHNGVHSTEVAAAYLAQNDGSMFADIDGDVLIDTVDPRGIRHNSRKALL